jgi:hypothetical protein
MYIVKLGAKDNALFCLLSIQLNNDVQKLQILIHLPFPFACFIYIFEDLQLQPKK